MRFNEPSLAAPENHNGSQVVWMRGGDRDGEAEATEHVLPDALAEPEHDPIVIPWHGRGNDVAAAGSFLVDLMGHG